MKFRIKRWKIDEVCCFVQLEDGRWMGLGDLIAENLGHAAELGEWNCDAIIEIETKGAA